MIWEMIILILAVPAGYLIAYLARDELIIGRRWFRILIIAGILGAMGFWVYGRKVESLSSAFIVIISLTSLIKSFDKKWTRKRV